MTNPIRFFSASARDLKVQALTVQEIAERMKPVNEESLRLPRSFAQSLRQIISQKRNDNCYNCRHNTNDTK